ncbi:hypothetical protein M9H77_30078 [Catharanthus roseus]|uniref:Uncharacterized protein n=1 Tax=Catharanthus roseus TaxID=4058 RepID=A0ACC0A055_CATRO|nr:hypothetical protein M9H77_30078 [Catharanthus roseus]
MKDKDKGKQRLNSRSHQWLKSLQRELKRERDELKKSERVKENECFIEKHESEKEEQREKEIVVLEKSEEVNFYANKTNSFFASEFLCVQNFEDSIVGFLEFNCASFVVFHEHFKERYVENCDPILSFFKNFVNDFDGIMFLNLSLPSLSNLVKLICHKQNLANVITSLNTLFESTFGFQFYHLDFKELLSKDFENQMGANLEFCKVNTLAFENSNLRKEAFEQVCKDFFCVENCNYLGYVVSLQGLQVGANMVQAIKDCLTSRSSFEERSFHSFASFYRKVIKDFSTIDSSLMVVPGRKPDSLGKIVYLLLNHALNLDQEKKMEFVKFFHSKIHDAVDVHNKKFGMKVFVFDPRGCEVDQQNEAPTDVKPGLLTRNGERKLKIHEANKANGMAAYMEEALKNKLEEVAGLRKASKLFSICSIRKDHFREQIEGENSSVFEEECPTTDSSPAQ